MGGFGPFDIGAPANEGPFGGETKALGLGPSGPLNTVLGLGAQIGGAIFAPEIALPIEAAGNIGSGIQAATQGNALGAALGIGGGLVAGAGALSGSSGGAGSGPATASAGGGGGGLSGAAPAPASVPVTDPFGESLPATPSTFSSDILPSVSGSSQLAGSSPFGSAMDVLSAPPSVPVGGATPATAGPLSGANTVLNASGWDTANLSASNDLAGIPSITGGSNPGAGLSAGGIGSATGGASSATGGGTGGSAGGGFTRAISNLVSEPSLSNAGAVLGNISPSVLLPAGVLGYEALEGQKPVEDQPQVQNEANQLNAQGQQLESYLSTGTLPAGVQQSLNQAAASAQAEIRSQYAARGMSGSSAEAQDLANVTQTVATQGASIAMNLLNEGVSEQDLSSQLYGQIINYELNQDQQLGSAITNLAIATAGGIPGLMGQKVT